MNQLCSMISGVVVRPLDRHDDNRGWLIELFRCDELSEEAHPTMAYVSETLPGVVRGPHEHAEQADLFAFLGPGDFELHLWDRREGSATLGRYKRICAGESNPLAVIVPPGVVHAYKNISDKRGWVFNPDYSRNGK
jgi:dTDP-4-dehydrorhamnose 3,5-epimerase